jgi:hypothetical protein
MIDRRTIRMTDHECNVARKPNSRAAIQKVRGPQSWNYIGIVLTFVVSIEWAIIHALLERPANIITLTIIVALTIWLFTSNEWLHAKLTSLKHAARIGSVR